MQIDSGVSFIGRVGDTAPEDGGCPIGGEFVKVTSDEVFKGRRVVLFALPGAFTPTCSAEQLPGFEAAYDEIISLGVDEVYCLSVNDGFVMNAWFEKEGITKVKPLCDGNGTFTQNSGMWVDKGNLGFGMRSWRYAMIVNDAEVEQLFSEPGKGHLVDDDPYGESSPEKVLEYLRSQV